MTGLAKYLHTVVVLVGGLFAGSAMAAPLFIERIFPDTKITRVKTEYDAETNLFTQRTRLGPDELPATSALYRQTIDANGDEITELEWNLTAQVDNDGNYLGGGSFKLFGAVDFEDPAKTDLTRQLLLSGGIAAFGITVFERVVVTPGGTFETNLISYNILGLTLYSAPGIDYSGYLGMIWTDDPTPLAGGGSRTNAQELFGSDWESDDNNVTRAQADIFLVPVPPSLALLLLPLLVIIRQRKSVAGIK